MCAEADRLGLVFPISKCGNESILRGPRKEAEAVAEEIAVVQVCCRLKEVERVHSTVDSAVMSDLQGQDGLTKETGNCCIMNG